MSVQSDLENIQYDLFIEDESYGIRDRGEMYLRVHDLTDSPAAVIEGNISTFSGVVGGAAYLANYVLVDSAQHGGATYNYSMSISNGTNEIFLMSESVAEGFISTAIIDAANTTSGHGGNISIANGVNSAESVWSNDPDSNLLNRDLSDQFPGTIFGIVNGQAISSIPGIGLWINGGEDGKNASISGLAGSILFGKSIEDFSGKESQGYQVLAGPDYTNTDLLGIQNYALHFDPSKGGANGPVGDRNGDGILNYQDGVVVMVDSNQMQVTSTAYMAGVNGLLLIAAGVIEGINTYALTLHWDNYRDWQLMKDFRVQQVEGGEYDFVKYAEAHGIGEEKDFWSYSETLLGDLDGVVRNVVFRYDRTENGTSGNDHLYGGSGQDALSGGDGDDTIRAGWKNDQLVGGDGNDNLYGERDDDRLIGGQGNDLLDGGQGKDTADYSLDASGITVTSWSSTGNGSITDGSGDTDTLVSIEKIIGTTGVDHFNLSLPGGHTIDGGGGDDIISYTTAGVYDVNTGFYWNSTGTVYDTLINIPTSNIQAQRILPSVSEASDFAINTAGVHTIYDYSDSTSNATINVSGGTHLSFTGDGETVYAVGSVGLSASVVLGNGVNYYATAGNFSNPVTSAVYQPIIDQATLDGAPFSINIVGTNHGDIVTLDNTTDPNHYGIFGLLEVVNVNFVSGSGDDDITINPTYHPFVTSTGNVEYTGGNDVIHNSGWLQSLTLWEGISLNDITSIQMSGSHSYPGIGELTGYDLTLTINGAGTLKLEDISSIFQPTITLLSGGSISIVGNPYNNYDTTNDQIVVSGTSHIASVVNGTWGDDVWTARDYEAQTFYAYGGNDILTASTGNTFLYGGGGNDQYIYDGRGGQSTLNDVNGNDIILISDVNIQSSNVDYIRKGEDLMIGIVKMGTDSDGFPVYNGTMTITGFYGEKNTIDILRFSSGSADIDLHTVSHVTNLIVGSVEDDILDDSGSYNSSFIYGRSGDDTIYAGTGDDTLYGGDGDDTIYGNDGDDIIDGGLGANDLNGGAGNDTYILSSSIFNTVYDDEGVNRIITEQAPPAFYNLLSGITLNDINGDSYAQLNGTFSTITFGDHSVLSFNDIYSNHIVYYQPTEGDDYIDPQSSDTYGDFAIDLLAGNDEYHGGINTDIVNGGDGNDTIYGGSGNDILNGGADIDDLHGGQGNDLINGGEGADAVNYSADWDAISGIVVDLSQNIVSNDGYGTVDTLISIEDVLGSSLDDVIIGSNGDNDLFGWYGNDTINGLSGDDYLQGDAGDDILNGGLGDDTYAFYLGDGSGDVISDDGGDDTIYIGDDLTIEDIAFSRSGDDLVVNYGDVVTVIDFYSGDASKVIERLSFRDNSTFDLTTLLSSNSPPVAKADEFIAITNQVVVGNVLADNGNGLDSDLNNDALSVTSLSILSTNGIAVTISTNGDFTYIPAVDFVGTDSFEYTISDGHGGTDTATVTLTYGPQLVDITGTPDDDYLSDDGIASSLIGGNGNDTYEVTNASTVVVESPDGGYDGVNSSVSFILGDNVEYIYLTGSGNINATGNAFGNYMVGNSGNNIIIGGAGDDTLFDGGGIDTLIGGADNDQYNITNIAATIVELSDEGYDNVDSSVTYTLPDNVEGLWLSGTDNIDATGNASDNYIVGNSGNNTLSGGDGNDTLIDNGGVDTLIGGAGDDLYNISNVAVTLIELNDEGYDTIDSSVTYTLPDNIESIWLGGADNIDATGNSSDNYIVGNSGNNTLIGGDGNDTLIGNGGIDILIGGEGDDLYQVTDSNTVITENIGEGYDEVDSNVSFILSSNIDSLWLGGEDDINGTGNSLDNYIVGNSGSNVLDGGAGDDTLYGEAGDDIIIGNAGSNFINGGEGADTFRFISASASDTIGDFSISDGDKLDVSQLLEGYDPLSSAIADFVKITESDGNSILSINAEGTGVSGDYHALATLSGVTGITDVNAFLTDNHIIVA